MAVEQQNNLVILPTEFGSTVIAFDGTHYAFYANETLDDCIREGFCSLSDAMLFVDGFAAAESRRVSAYIQVIDTLQASG